MVNAPVQYRWSSYRYNGQGKDDEPIKPHPMYMALGTTRSIRIEVYKVLFRAHLDKDVLTDIRSAFNTGTLLGNDYFRQRVKARLNCKVGQARWGRAASAKREGKGSDPLELLCRPTVHLPTRVLSGFYLRTLEPLRHAFLGDKCSITSKNYAHREEMAIQAEGVEPDPQELFILRLY
jgi:hypothetical protein